MKIKNSFDVPSSPEVAWRLLNDIPAVVPCMPGAELTEMIDADTFNARVRVKLGPIALEFATEVVRIAADEDALQAALRATAREVKGRGGAEAEISSTLTAIGGGTRVEIVSDLALQGTVAQYGSGVVEQVAARMTKEFADCIRARLAVADEAAPSADPGGPAIMATPAPPVAGLRLLFGAAWRWLTERFRAAK
jgi:carbon monoxide dehydrogenase subunit G